MVGGGWGVKGGRSNGKGRMRKQKDEEVLKNTIRVILVMVIISALFCPPRICKPI